MTDMVAKLWVNHGLAPSEVIDAPKPVLFRALSILEKRVTKDNDDAAFDRLRRQLESGG